MGLKIGDRLTLPPMRFKDNTFGGGGRPRRAVVAATPKHGRFIVARLEAGYRECIDTRRQRRCGR